MMKIKLNIKKRKIKISWLILIFIINLLFFSTQWAMATYGNINVEELIFHIKVPLNNVESGIIKGYIVQSLFIAIIVTIICYILFDILFNNLLNKEVYLKLKTSVKEFKFKLLPYSRYGKFVVPFLIILIFFELYLDLNRLGIKEWFCYQAEESTFIKDNYVSAKDISYTFPKKKKNLIHIILESYESSYFSNDLGGYFETNLIEELMPFMDEGTYFSNTEKFGGALDLRGTSWTVGAMVAQTSGIPLLIPIDGNSYGKYSSFLPGVYTLGEILKDNGYNNYIMMGSDASFAGRDLYFSQHGEYEIFDYIKAKEESKIPSDYNVWWGFEDSKLYTFAKEKLTNISKNEEPFNFLLLTADTHTLDGYVDISCENKYEDNYLNSISCASNQLSKFLLWLKEQDFYKDTVVVITGDHISMQPDFINNYQRTVFNLILNTNKKTTNTKNRMFTVVDVFPTILYTMDIEASSNRIGIGTNLYSNDKTIVEQYGIYNINIELQKRQKFYNDTFVYQKNSKHG